MSHFPLNSDSETDQPAQLATSYTVPSAHIALNSDSESEADRPPIAISRGRQQQQQQATETNSGDEEDPSTLQAYPPRSRSSRSRTPKGLPTSSAGSRSRSRSRLGSKGKLEARMMNSESEDLSASSAGEEGEGGLAVLKESTTYVPQNSGSEQEDEPVERQAGRTKGLSAGGKSASRSRSRGRVPRYDVQLNSESSSDEVEVESLGPALTGGVEKIDLAKGIELNSESERE